MNLEFAGRFNSQDLVLKEFKYWVIQIRANVVTLGSCVIILKSGKAHFKDVSAEEMAEFAEVCKWFEEKTKALYGAEKWNYLALMMADEFVHYHAIPRYSKEVNFYDTSWFDADWPKPTNLKTIDVNDDVFEKIKIDMMDK